MPEESTTSDLVEIGRRIADAHNRGDLDAVTDLYHPGVVYDLSVPGPGIFEGAAAVRGFLESYFAAFEDLVYEVEEIVLLDNRVGLAIVRKRARPAGAAGHVSDRHAHVYVFSPDGLVLRHSSYLDIHEARAAAERLAHERE
jgi:ketosteroid isomerase-like protein